MDRYSVLTRLPFLHYQDIADIIWAAEGVKPTSSLQLGERTENQVDSLIEVLNNYGLFISYRVVDFYGPYQVISFALKQEMVRAIQQLDNRSIPRNLRWRRLGELFGFPTTTIDGFVQERTIEEEYVLPQVLSREEFRAFMATRPFRLSQRHWRTEAEVAQTWIASLKKATPAMFQYILSCERGMQYA